jgi:hypothetical protein
MIHRYFWFDLTQIFISKKFEKEIVFESYVLAWIRNWIRIRIEQKCWIRIRIESIRIHNPAYRYVCIIAQIVILSSNYRYLNSTGIHQTITFIWS